MQKTVMGIWAGALAIGLVAGGAAQAADLKVCFVYVGPVGDYGWSYQHDQGRQAIEAHFGDRVETAYLENVAEGPDAERAIERLARSDCGLIFSTSFGFMDATLAVAEKFPDVKFEHATGYKRAENVSIYNSRFYEGRYIIGQIAAKLSESGIAGYIGSFPIPEVVMGINAFLLGAQSIDPDFEVKIVWVNSWFDPGKEADAATALLDQGADIVTQHTDSTAPLQVVEERGALGFGQSSDMIQFAPNAQLTSIIDDWAPYYIERTQAVLDGTWESIDTWKGIGEGAVVMAPYTNMPEDVATAAAALEEQITSGALHPFTGPITRQDGARAAERGEVLTDETLLGMNWYVQGIDDRLPQ